MNELNKKLIELRQVKPVSSVTKPVVAQSTGSTTGASSKSSRYGGAAGAELSE